LPAAAAGAYEPGAPIEHRGCHAISLGHLAGVGLDLVLTVLAPHDQPDAGGGSVAECHRRTGVGLHPEVAPNNGNYIFYSLFGLAVGIAAIYCITGCFGPINIRAVCSVGGGESPLDTALAGVGSVDTILKPNPALRNASIMNALASADAPAGIGTMRSNHTSAYAPERRLTLHWPSVNALSNCIAHSGDCDRPFQPKVITDSGDRDHVLTWLTERREGRSDLRRRHEYRLRKKMVPVRSTARNRN
jgi:hypothetical protein